MLSRIILGTRASLLIATGVVVLSTTTGVAAGMIAGYYRRLDNVVMRVMDAMMAFPAIMLALAILAILGRTAVNLVFAIAIVYTPPMARISRSVMLAYREMGFVEAALAMGASDFWVISRHLFPNVVPGGIIQATYFFATALLAESALSFLGLGLSPDTPSWGMLLGDGRRSLREAPWTTVFPGLVISVAIVVLNVAGDSIRDRLDPRLRGTGN